MDLSLPKPFDRLILNSTLENFTKISRRIPIFIRIDALKPSLRKTINKLMRERYEVFEQTVAADPYCLHRQKAQLTLPYIP